MNESNKSITSQSKVTNISQTQKSDQEVIKDQLKGIQETLKKVTDNQKTIQNAMKVMHEEGIDLSKLDKKTKTLIKNAFEKSGHFDEKELKILNLLVDSELKTPSGQDLFLARKENKLEKLDQTSGTSKIPGSVIWAAIATLMALHSKNDASLKDIQKRLKELQGNIHLYNELSRILNEAKSMNDGKGPNGNQWAALSSKFNAILGKLPLADQQKFHDAWKERGLPSSPIGARPPQKVDYIYNGMGGVTALQTAHDAMVNLAKKLTDEATEESTKAQDVMTKNNDIISIASALSGGQKDQAGQFWSRM